MQPKLHKRAVTRASTCGPEFRTDCMNTHGRDAGSNRKGGGTRTPPKGLWSVQFSAFCCITNLSFLQPFLCCRSKQTRVFPALPLGSTNRLPAYLLLCQGHNSPTARILLSSVSVSQVWQLQHTNCSKLTAPQQKFNCTARRALWRNPHKTHLVRKTQTEHYSMQNTQICKNSINADRLQTITCYAYCYYKVLAKAKRDNTPQQELNKLSLFLCL